MSLPPSLREPLADRFGIDARGLAVARIALGLLVLCDLALRLPHLVAMYTDAGVLPRSLLLEAYPFIGQLSLYTLSGSLAWALLLFGLTALAAVAFAVGYRSRLAAFALFVLLLSLHARNLTIANAGDWLLRRLMLWFALVPAGRRWGLDARRGSTTDRIASLATAGVLVQVVVVYAVNAVLKLRGDLWVEGVAVQYIYQVDALTVGLGDLVAGTPLLAVGSHAWMALLVCSPLLVLARRRVRTLLVAALAGGHLFMFLTLRLGVFPLISMASLLLFVPTAVWDRVERRTNTLRARVRDRASIVPTPGDWHPAFPRPATQTLAAGLLAFVLVWSTASVGLVALPAAPVDPTERRWDMFAPHPKTADTWDVPVGTTTDGEQVDAFRGGDPAFAVADSTSTYPSIYWYLYLDTLSGTSTLRPGFAAYLCDRWAARHDSRLASVDLVHVTQETYPETESPERRSLGRFDCSA
ncbi:HTTM domain-containing protein [Halobacteriales archaeon SW_8_65_20]|nr:MAG: HTTM domain-containing protein [Halobacteriales archaeon SW_8_65_20]